MIEIGLISNPNAKSGKNLKLINSTVKLLNQKLGKNYKIHNLSDKTWDLALKNARDIIDKKLIHSLIVLGGDGMVNLGVNCTVNSKVNLGIIPFGSGNDFADYLKIPINNIELCIEKLSTNIKNNNIRVIDVGVVNLLDKKGRSTKKRYFAGSLSAGIDSKICYRANNMKLGGRFKYLIAGIIELFKIDYSSYLVKWNDKQLETNGVLCTISNTPQIGGGFIISPNSKIDDSYLDFVFAKYPGKFRSMYLFFRALKGKHIKSRKVFSVKTKEVILKNSNMQGNKKIPKLFADGEYIGEVNAKISICPNSISILN